MDERASKPSNQPKSDPSSVGGGGSQNASDFGEQIRFVRSGHKEALGGLLQTCRSYLLLVANSEVPNNLQAKVGASDVVQETFLQAHEIFERFRGNTQSELRAWLIAILENKLAQAKRQYLGTDMRDVAREMPYAADSGEAGVAVGIDPQADSPSAIFEAVEEARRFEAAMLRMPADYQTAIELRNLEGKSFAELGLVLDRTPDAARKLWLRAFERLQKELGPSENPGDPLIDNDEPQGART